MALDSLEQFTSLKTLRATHNELREVIFERLPRLKHLDLSHNQLDGIPDLSGVKALIYLNLSNNVIGTRPDSEITRDGWEHIKNAKLANLKTLMLHDNALNWDQVLVFAHRTHFSHMPHPTVSHISHFILFF